MVGLHVIPPNSNNSLIPQGNNNLKFQLGHAQVMHLGTAANMCASWPDVKKRQRFSLEKAVTLHEKGFVIAKNISDQQRGKCEHFFVLKLLILLQKWFPVFGNSLFDCCFQVGSSCHLHQIMLFVVKSNP